MVNPPLTAGFKTQEPTGASTRVRAAVPVRPSSPSAPSGTHAAPAAATPAAAAKASRKRIPQAQHIQYAGFWVRLGATVIDLLLLSTLMLPLLLLRQGGTGVGAVLAHAGLWLLPMGLVIACWRWVQATPGKKVVSARILDARTGRPPTLGQCIARGLAYLAALLPFGLGLVWVAFDPRKQGWHDKLAGTVVIRPLHDVPEPEPPRQGS